jgi:hypothetical protein
MTTPKLGQQLDNRIYLVIKIMIFFFLEILCNKVNMRDKNTQFVNNE